MRTVIGALAEDATPEEVRSRDHLLAIRSLLIDLLLARDAVYRLVRSDGLDVQRPNRLAFEPPVPGARGNDLLRHIAYHTLAALNHSYAIGDNLKWVLLHRSGVAIGDWAQRLNLIDVLQARMPRLRESDLLRQAGPAILASTSCREMLGLRAIRNHWIHHLGVDHGRVTFETHPGHREEAFAVWLLNDNYERHWATIGTLARVSDADVAVLAFDDLLTSLWTSTAATLTAVLASFEWTSADWILASPEGRAEMPAMGRTWDRRLQERMWGLNWVG